LQAYSLQTVMRARHAARFVLTLAMLCLACSADGANSPIVSGNIKLVSGGAQIGVPGEPLRQEIVVTLLDTAGAPVAGVLVEWEADDGGVIEPSASITAADGRAAARWTLGTAVESHRAMAQAEGFAPLAITALPPLPLPEIDAIRLLDLTTYDGSNQTTHPDYAVADASWPVPRHHLAITPYPQGDANFENPSVYESFGSTRWRVPPLGANPIAISGTGHMSDPDMLFDPDRREFMLYFREVAGENLIWLMRSPDAAHWSVRELVAHAPNHGIVSPAVVRRSADEWLMWSVNGNLGCDGITTSVELRRSTDGISWSAPEETALSQPGRYPWHIDVQWMPDRSEYWALFNAKVDRTCSTPALYLATSPDGVDWKTYPTPVISRGAIPEFEDIIYRSTFKYNPANGIMTFWYSGARYVGTRHVWNSAVQRRSRDAVLHAVSQVPHAETAALSVRRGVPSLMDPP
jgi:hypothetical protein